MLLDSEVANFTRRCAATGRALNAGELYYSTIHIEQRTPVRRDLSADAWQGPPSDCVAWWQSRVADGDAGRAPTAPQDVLLNLFAALASEPAEAEFRYVLGLLLLRRRLVKLGGSRPGVVGEMLLLDCPRRNEKMELLVVSPTPEGVANLERRLCELLYGDAA